MHRFDSSRIVITLPNTPAIREALMQLGGHGVDDNATFFEESAEDPMSSDSPERCAELADAYRAVNAAILQALGLAIP
jgi:hypothetical protein